MSEKVQPQKSLNDILSEMPSLQDLSDYHPTVYEEEDGEVVYDEMITHDMAKIILGKRYDTSCRYKLVTQRDVTVLVKINDAWPVGKPPITDKEGRIVDGPTVEYVLESESTSDVQSYSAMLADIQLTRDNAGTKQYNAVDKPKSSSAWMYILAGVGIAMILIWILLMIALNTLKGGF